MIWDTLEVAGVDRSLIDVLKMFYWNNQHLLKLKGEVMKGISVHSGVRQGCPLSGLLFAICVDVLLSKISKVLHVDEEVGAFADDIADVVEDIWKNGAFATASFQRVRIHIGASPECTQDVDDPTVALHQQRKHWHPSQRDVSRMGQCGSGSERKVPRFLSRTRCRQRDLGQTVGKILKSRDAMVRNETRHRVEHCCI